MNDPSNSGLTPTSMQLDSKEAQAREVRTDYDRLREWYLARLRTQFTQHQRKTNFTPSVLIRTDNLRIEQLMLQIPDTRNVDPEGKDDIAGPSLWTLAIFGFAGQLVLMLVLVTVQYHWSTDDSAQRLLLALVSFLAEVSYCIFILFLFRSKIVDRLLALQERLISSVSLAVSALPRQSGNTDEITLCSKAAQQLRQHGMKTEQKLNTIADYAQQVICTLDQEGVFKAVSPSIQLLAGYSALQLLGKGIHGLLPVGQANIFPELFLQTIQQKKESVFETVFKTTSNQVVEVRLTIEWSESQRCFFCLIDDITAEKRVERLKQEFLAMVTHDLKSPLTSIYGSCRLILAGAHGEFSDAVAKPVNVIAASSERLLALVNELLDIERFAEGRMPLDMTEIPVCELLEQVRDMMLPQCVNRQITLRLEAPDLSVFGDRGRITQLLINLISNAIKFSPASGQITVKAQFSSASMHFSISDQGRGISQEDKEKVFDRFRQLELSDAALKGGSGLGLSICKAIVEAHSGNIGVISTVGEGSTFWFSIPTARPAETAARGIS